MLCGSYSHVSVVDWKNGINWSRRTKPVRKFFKIMLSIALALALRCACIKNNATIFLVRLLQLIQIFVLAYIRLSPYNKIE